MRVGCAPRSGALGRARRGKEGVRGDLGGTLAAVGKGAPVVPPLGPEARGLLTLTLTFAGASCLCHGFGLRCVGFLAGLVRPVPRFRWVLRVSSPAWRLACATVSVAGVWFLASRVPACATTGFDRVGPEG